MMLQYETPTDYVVATNQTQSIRDFLTEAFSVIGIYDWTKYVVVNPKFLRPAEVDVLRGDARLAREILGWEVRTPFDVWVKRMVKNDINLLRGK